MLGGPRRDSPAPMTLIYKIMDDCSWSAAKALGIVEPAPVDVTDGYIHLSTEKQVLETVRRHFAGRDGLVAVAFHASDFGAALKWEISRGGALFPHLYADLPAVKAVSVRRLKRIAFFEYEFGEVIE